MGKYSMDMSGEKEPSGTTIFKEGWHNWEIVSVEEKTSKKGNQMFVIQLAEDITYQTIDIFAIAVEGKRWFLKQFLAACGCVIVEGVYDWDSDELIGKKIAGLIENNPEEYVNREGNAVTTTRSRVVKFDGYREIKLEDAAELQGET